MDEIAKPHCSIQIKTSKKYFPLVGFRGWEKGKNTLIWVWIESQKVASNLKWNYMNNNNEEQCEI